MALSDDQKAMLKLLAQRDTSYEEIASLMGITVDELHARVKEALAEGGAVGETSQSAEPPPPEPAAPSPEPVPAPSAPTHSSPSPPPAPTARADRPSPLRGLRESENRGALIGISAGALVLLALVIVLIVAGDGGGGSSSGSTAAGSTSPTSSEEQSLTQATLEPTNGGDASGRALFGRYKKNVLLQVQAEGLDPSPAGQTYTIWLYRSPKLVLRLGAVKVGDSGKLAVQLPVPVQVLTYVASGAFDQIDVSLTPTAAYRAELAKAKAAQRLPKYIGESVLRGEITGPAVR
ncbi:MAG TPA: hypothetical protein VF245_09205 [Solirubrobacterales bacterium]